MNKNVAMISEVARGLKYLNQDVVLSAERRRVFIFMNLIQMIFDQQTMSIVLLSYERSPPIWY
jgi:hypothetical protein